MGAYGFRSRISMRIVVCVLLAVLLLLPSGTRGLSSGTSANVIVQGARADLTSIVRAAGGKVTRALPIIDAVAARLPADRVAALEKAPGVTRVWSDSGVAATDSADPGVQYAPVSGGDYAGHDLDLNKVGACDGARLPMDQIRLNVLDPNEGQLYTFVRAIDPNNRPAQADLRVVFKEKSLGQALVRVYQASTGAWRTFNIPTLGTDDKVIDTTLDLSYLLAVPGDMANLQVRFQVSANAGGQKAEVDCFNLHLGAFPAGTPDARFAASTAREYHAADFDLSKVLAIDGKREPLASVRLNSATSIPLPGLMKLMLPALSQT